MVAICIKVKKCKRLNIGILSCLLEKLFKMDEQ